MWASNGWLAVERGAAAAAQNPKTWQEGRAKVNVDAVLSWSRDQATQAAQAEQRARKLRRRLELSAPLPSPSSDEPADARSLVAGDGDERVREQLVVP